jgi:MFS family permease
VRRFVDEPSIFVAARKRAESGEERRNFLAIFAPTLLRATFLGSLLSRGTLGGGYAVTIWLPTYLKTVRDLSVVNTTGFLAVTIVASFLGYVTGAYFSDWLGRRRAFLLFSLCTAATVVLYMLVPISNTAMLFLGFPLGFFSAGVYSGIGALLNELYPTAVRGSGLGFCFNFGRAMGAVFPFLVGVLSASMPLGQAIGVFTVTAYGLVVIAAYLLPETNGQPLKSTPPMAAALCGGSKGGRS